MIKRNTAQYPLRPVIDHFNEAFQNAMVNSPNQSIDEHVIKFKGSLSIKQFKKFKPIKSGFKYLRILYLEFYTCIDPSFS